MREVDLKPGWLRRDVDRALARLKEWASPKTIVRPFFECPDCGADLSIEKHGRDCPRWN